MTRARLVWVVVAVLGILSGLSVPRAHTTEHVRPAHTEAASEAMPR